MLPRISRCTASQHGSGGICSIGSSGTTPGQCAQVVVGDEADAGAGRAPAGRRPPGRRCAARMLARRPAGPGARSRARWSRRGRSRSARCASRSAGLRGVPGGAGSSGARRRRSGSRPSLRATSELCAGAHHAQRDVGLAPQQVAELVATPPARSGCRARPAAARPAPAAAGSRPPTWLAVMRTLPVAASRRPASCAPALARRPPSARAASAMRQRHGGGRDAAAGALEQRRAELRLQLGDVPAQRRLLRAQAARRAHQAAGVEHGQEAADQAPSRSRVFMHKCIARNEPIRQLSDEPAAPTLRAIDCTRSKEPRMNTASPHRPRARRQRPLRRRRRAAPSPPPAGACWRQARRRAPARRCRERAVRWTRTAADPARWPRAPPAPASWSTRVNPPYTDAAWRAEALPLARAGHGPRRSAWAPRFMLPGQRLQLRRRHAGAAAAKTRRSGPTTLKGRLRVRAGGARWRSAHAAAGCAAW